MAELIQLRIEDFRAFHAVSLDLKPYGLMLVTGPNNVGKSALLSALDVIAGIDTPVGTRHAGGKACRIFARWQLTDDEGTTLLGSTSETARLMAENAAQWLEWEFAELHATIQPVAVSISWPGKERLEFARIESPSGTSWTNYRANGPLATWNQEYDGGGSGSGGHINNTLGQLNLTGNLSPAAEVLNAWRAGYFHFKPLREAEGRESGLTSVVPVLANDGGNLAAVLLHLHTNTPDTWHQLVALVQQIVPGVGQLMTPVNGSQSSVVFQDEQVSTHRHNLKDLGTGVEQLLMTLVVGLTQAATTVLLEEPETGLHPGAQRALLGLFQDWSKDRLFVASTHSATMLDWTSPTTSVLAVSRVGLESTVTPVTTERTEVLRELGVRLSDVLSAEYVLILEGPTDKDIFDVWFPAVIRNPRVVVVDGGGGYNARHADLFVRWLGSVDQLGVRRVLYARDRDELSAKFFEKLKSSPYVYVLPCRELEDLLLDFGAITEVVNHERSQMDKPTVAAEEIATKANELATELKPIIVLKRVMGELAEPIRLVDNDLRSKLAKARANEADLKAEVLKRLPDRADVDASVSQSWQSHVAAVDRVWEQEWKNLVPGADLLSALWKTYLGRKYRKSSDGIAIATNMKEAPASLANTLRKFIGEDRGSDHS